MKSGCDQNLMPIEIVQTTENAEKVSIRGVLDARMTGLSVSYFHASGASAFQQITDNDQILDLKCSDEGFSDVEAIVSIGGNECKYDIIVPCVIDEYCGSQCIDNFRVTELSTMGNYAGTVHISAASDENAVIATISKPAGEAFVDVIYPSTDGLETRKVVEAEVSFLAHCDGARTEVDVVIPISDDEEVCDGRSGKETVYTFIISCVSDCEDEKVRRHMQDESFNYESCEDPTQETEEVTYCNPADFPCEGEDENMVFVCHYSPRRGYQTFCLPEADSAILRLQSKDHCGQCEGGFGDSAKK